MKDHPHLSILYSKYTSETQPFRKVHRMIDWFESLIKTHTGVILAEYIRHNKFSENIKLLLSQGLYTPTLGIWRRIGQDLFKELEKQETFKWTVPEFREEYQNLLKALERKETNVIELRNFYAHGATPKDEQCERHIKEFEPFLFQLTQLVWLDQSKMIDRKGKVFLVVTNGELSLHPVLVYREENSEASLAFFNDLKYEKVGLLNYPLSKYYREKDFYQEFQEILPLNDWKRSSRERFGQQIDELTESFKGRKEELAKLMEFVTTKKKGFFSVLGNPGIGKSTLIAQLIKELRELTEFTNIKVIEYFVKREAPVARPEFLLNYLIRKTDEVFKEGKNIRSEKNDLYSLKETLFEKWREWSLHSQGEKLLFLIDGLDEGAETDLLTFLPRENFENILIIYGSRPGGHKSVEDFFTALPVEYHTKLELVGLRKDDIRALIYEVGNKYEIERESMWIEAILKRSDGYPLYLKLLCDSISNGVIALNDISALPEKINEYYKGILWRYTNDHKYGNAILRSLFTLAAAKDYLNLTQLGRINNFDEITKIFIGSILREVLSKKENYDEASSYQLFHESFREYLQKEKKEEVEEARERIIEFCTRWEELEGSASQYYALQYYATHLKESRKSKRRQELLQLLNNKDYIRTQKQVLRQFDSTKNLRQLGLAEACEQNNWEVQLETALSLVDLKYEEANDVSAVVDMIANEEIELALKRIENFGGQDQEGLKRKFILYMLCLAELTLLGSKEKPFRKKAIEILINHFNHQFPVGNSVINWNEFFPTQLIHLISIELNELEISYMNFYKYTKKWEGLYFTNKKNKLNKKEIKFLIESAKELNESIYKNIAYQDIARILAKQGEIENSLLIANKISSNYSKSIVYSIISKELALKDQFQVSLKLARNISEPKIKSLALLRIASILTEKGKRVESSIIIKEALTDLYDFGNEQLEFLQVSNIILKLAQNGAVEDALIIAKTIKNKFIKGISFSILSTILFFQNRKSDAILLLIEGKSTVSQLEDAVWRNKAFSILSIELIKQNKLIESISLIEDISFYETKCETLINIAIELFKQKKGKEGESIIQKAINLIGYLDNSYDKYKSLTSISKIYISQQKIAKSFELLSDVPERFKSRALSELAIRLFEANKIEEGMKLASMIQDEKGITITFKVLADKLIENGELNEAVSLLKDNLINIKKYSERYWKERELVIIGKKLAKEGYFNKSLWVTKFINENHFKDEILSSIGSEIVEKRNIKYAIQILSKIKSDYWRDKTISLISLQMANKNELVKAIELTDSISDETERIINKIIISIIADSQFPGIILKNYLDEIFKIGNKINQADTLLKIYRLLLDNNKEKVADLYLLTALEFSRQITDEFHKSSFLKEIFSELTKKGKEEDAKKIYHEALTFAKSIEEDFRKSRALNEIFQELISLGLEKDAINILPYIIDQSEKDDALTTLSISLSRKKQFSSAVKNSRKIIDIDKRLQSLCIIYSYMEREEKHQESFSILSEIFDLIKNLKKLIKSKEISRILIAFADEDNWEIAEKIFFEIPENSIRENSWENIAKNQIIKSNWKDALLKKDFIKNQIAYNYYLIGWAKCLNSMEVDKSFLQISLPYIIRNTDSLEILLQKYALYETFLGNSSQEQLNRFTQSLNIQWALDILKSFPKESKRNDPLLS